MRNDRKKLNQLFQLLFISCVLQLYQWFFCAQITKLSECITRMKLDVYSCELDQECVDK